VNKTDYSNLNCESKLLPALGREASELYRDDRGHTFGFRRCLEPPTAVESGLTKSRIIFCGDWGPTQIGCGLIDIH
jgi:hypothetical protein